MSSSQHKPTKQELLKQLESIRASLLPSDEEVPDALGGLKENICNALTSVATDEEGKWIESLVTDTEINETLQEAYNIADVLSENSLEVDGEEYAQSLQALRAETMTDTRTPSAPSYTNKPQTHMPTDTFTHDSTPLHTPALPGQQSLFEPNSSPLDSSEPEPAEAEHAEAGLNEAELIKVDVHEAEANQSKANATNADKALAPSEEVLTSEPQASESPTVELSLGENPFLPHHIKERLAQEKLHYQKDLEEVTRINASKMQPKQNKEHDGVIDELVAMYLPRIEQELRRRLRAKLSDDDDSNPS
ncbi:MAG: hypothetical protein ACI9Y1_003062 [Lentisphaeria bacterium]